MSLRSPPPGSRVTRGAPFVLTAVKRNRATSLKITTTASETSGMLRERALRLLLLRSGREMAMQSLKEKHRSVKSGATAIEYGLIAALIALVVITAASALGNKVSSKFNSVKTAMN